jgi:hypothetical protein
MQWSGNGNYTLEQSGKSLIARLYETKNSSLLRSDYIVEVINAEYKDETEKEFRYVFISQGVLGDWVYWTPDRDAQERLWQLRNFTSESELLSFADQVFSGTGFLKVPLNLIEIDRQTTRYIRAFQRCDGVLRKTKRANLSEAIVKCNSIAEDNGVMEWPKITHSALQEEG